ncbi:AAA domain-containing protein [Phthorimaea operculella]|nr:AAA domain-containing protein [Phthorimaea operculella]
MSKVINDKGIKPGCIYRITLENFVTYKEVELYPGPSLNMIIGPNGTGKSTFVCAIILGLCGKTSVIGRAKKISEYVRSGCQQATIEIELYQEPGQRNVIITRTFNLKDVSTWSIDHKTVREKQVQELIASMNIQVDNLCQLLPQDRVQDFSKMNPQELLRSTLAAVGGDKSVGQLDELIKCRNEQRTASTRLQNNAQNLEEQVRLNERLKILIEAMRERQEIEQKIEVCEKKKLWLEYQELREKVIEYSNDKKKADKVVKQHKDKMEPLERVIQTAKSGISRLEQQRLSANREIHSLKDKVKEHTDSVRQQEYSIKDAENLLQEKLERYRNRERELNEAKAKLDKLVTDRTRLMEKVGDETQVKMELAELHKPIAKCNAAIDTLKKQRLEIQYDLENNITPQIRLYENKIRNLQDVDQKRLEVLRAYSEDAYKAVAWLRENRDMFEHPVYEPMMLEINFTDPKFARYLESTVPARDLVAFTFESSQDMNLFLREVRQKGGLKRVNAICSQGGRVNVPTNNIQQLSYLGFYTYLVDTISAPDAITRYLCKQYNIHKIPIGNDHTYKNSGKVPANITFFFTENHRFVVRVSAYSGAKSSSTIEIRPARLLANTVDVDQLENFNNQLSNFNQNAQSRRSKMQEIDNKLQQLESNLEGLNTRRKKINEGVEKVRTISVQIRLQTKKVQEIEQEPAFDMQRERERCRRKQKECVLKQCNLHWDLMEIMQKLHNQINNANMWKAKLDISRNAIVQQESELRELRSELQNVQTTLENIEGLLNRAKSNAKEKLIEAKRSCNNKLPQDPDFPYKTDFDTLPSDIDRLQAHCIELQTRIDCMDKGDENVIKEYEEREKTIARLRSEVNETSDMNKQLEDRMNKLRSKWLPPLEQLLRDIDRQFGNMFAKLDCAGEIKLEKGGSEDDYDKYGVAILVRFRASEQLQQLTRQTQSGGERALSTALYLMSLQRLTTVPFRCVDEINQGMDPINERKMFQLLVKVTTESDNAQYFLLTPKGMDPINERKMFQLLVKVTTESDNAQYFLLTPKGMDPINERKMFQLLVKVTTESDNAQYFLLTPKGMDPINERKMFQLLVKVTTESDNAQYFLLTPKGMDPINERKMFQLLVKVTTESDNAQYFLLTPKCVDEINQGMDPINERKMFQLLVKVTTESDNAQYFLLTPKLLSNLEYNSHIMVHTIMNGKNICNYRKWKMPKFVERAPLYSQS